MESFWFWFLASQGQKPKPRMILPRICELCAAMVLSNAYRSFVIWLAEECGLEWYEDEVHSLEQSLTAAPPHPVVFYGSSSFRLWNTLGADLAPWPLVNRAFGGSTLAACVHFFERLVVPCAPRSIVCYAGDNDLGDGRPPAAVITAFDALVVKIEQYCGNLPLAYFAIKPSLARWPLRDAILEVNAAIKQRIDLRPRSVFIDTYTPMLGADGVPRTELFIEDGLHLSAAGYQLWAELIRPHGVFLGVAEASGDHIINR